MKWRRYYFKNELHLLLWNPEIKKKEDLHESDFELTLFVGWLGTVTELSFGSGLHEWTAGYHNWYSSDSWGFPSLDYNRRTCRISNQSLAGKYCPADKCDCIIYFIWLITCDLIILLMLTKVNPNLPLVTSHLLTL